MKNHWHFGLGEHVLSQRIVLIRMKAISVKDDDIRITHIVSYLHYKESLT